MTSRPDFVLCDLDDTLYSTKECHSAGLSSVARLLQSKLNIPEASFQAAWEGSRTKTKQRLGNTANSHSRLLYAKGMMEALGLGRQLDLINQIESSYWGSYLGLMRLAPGSLKLLEACRELAIPTFILTDLTTQVQIRKIVHLGLHSMITGLVTSEDVGSDKPNDGFVSYLREMYSLSGGEGWLLGDDLKDELMSAQFAKVDYYKISIGADGDDPMFYHLVKTLGLGA